MRATRSELVGRIFLVDDSITTGKIAADNIRADTATGHRRHTRIVINRMLVGAFVIILNETIIGAADDVGCHPDHGAS